MKAQPPKPEAGPMPTLWYYIPFSARIQEEIKKMAYLYLRRLKVKNNLQRTGKNGKAHKLETLFLGSITTKWQYNKAPGQA